MAIVYFGKWNTMQQRLIIRKKNTLVCSTMLHCPMIVVFDVSVLLLPDVSCKEVSLEAMLYMLPSTSTICTVIPLASPLLRISCQVNTLGYNIWKKDNYRLPRRKGAWVHGLSSTMAEPDDGTWGGPRVHVGDDQNRVIKLGSARATHRCRSS
jgi:hypothetical protein